MAFVELSGIRGIKGRIAKLTSSQLARPMLGEIGMFILLKIKKRTIKGEDVNGLDFIPYTPMYAKSRAKEGYSIKPVDLTKTGSMLSAMDYEYDDNSVDVFFKNTTDKFGGRNADKAFFLNENREFFALSDSDVKGIMVIVDEFYQQLMSEKGTKSNYVVREDF